MKTVKILLSTLAFLASVTFLNAQTTPEPRWFVVDYMKVKPGMGDKYLECEKIWKTIHKERRRLGKIVGWSIYQVRFPSGTHREYDYVTVTEVKGFKGVDNFYTGWADAYKVVAKEQVPTVEKTEQYRDLVKTEVYASEDAIYKEGTTSPAKFQVCNYMSVPEGRWDEYMAMEKNLAKPVHKLNMDNDKRLGWGIFGLVFPYGSTIPYQVVAIDFYDKWEDIGSGVEGAWKKIHPDMTEAYMNRQINETRKLLWAEVRVLVDYLD